MGIDSNLSAKGLGENEDVTHTRCIRSATQQKTIGTSHFVDILSDMLSMSGLQRYYINLAGMRLLDMTVSKDSAHWMYRSLQDYITYLMSSDLCETLEATPPIMNQGLSTVCPPLQLLPASSHKSK